MSGGGDGTSELEARHAEERELLNEELCAVLDEVATHKVEVTKLLENYEQRVFAVKKELEEKEPAHKELVEA